MELSDAAPSAFSVWHHCWYLGLPEEGRRRWQRTCQTHRTVSGRLEDRTVAQDHKGPLRTEWLLGRRVCTAGPEVEPAGKMLVGLGAGQLVEGEALPTGGTQRSAWSVGDAETPLQL